MDAASLGKVYLIPLPIVANTQKQVIPAQVIQVIQQLDYFLVENIRTARRYIASLGHPQPIADLTFLGIGKHTAAQQVATYMLPVHQGKNVGILSEAGCPGIADPGALAVQYAHQHNLEVVPLVGPSSILLALMASGFNGQNFVFHGYLPINKKERQGSIRKLEKAAWQLKQTQLFIETPYRNQALLLDVLDLCQPDTLLCIGKNITGHPGWIQAKSIQQWKAKQPNLHKIPAVFLLASPS